MARRSCLESVPRFYTVKMTELPTPRVSPSAEPSLIRPKDGVKNSEAVKFLRDDS